MLAGEYGPEALRQLARLGGLGKDEAGHDLPGAQSEAARVSAIGMLLDRAYGKSMPGRVIRVDLPDTSSLDGVTRAVAALVQAAAAGEVTPAEASDLCAILDVQRRAIELTEIEARIAKLEAGRT